MSSDSPRERALRSIPGLLLCVALAALAIFGAEFPFVKDRLHLSPLLLVILIGMAVRSVVPLPKQTEDGIALAQRPILRWAVAGLGFKLSVQQVFQYGVSSLAVVVLSTLVALAFGWWLAQRMGIPEKLGVLLGVGTAICGASAIVAADSVVKGERRDVAVSLGVITLLGTIGIIVNPLLGRALGMTDFMFGVWDGASLHEMAQVVAAGAAFSPEAMEVATVAKLARISLLAPTVFYLLWIRRRRSESAGEPEVAALPWFLIVFLVLAGVNSLGLLTADQLALAQRIDLWLLAIGMAGVGLLTGFRDIRDAGLKVVGLGVAQWVILAAVSYGLVYALCR